ncbi:hypothetical protein ACFQ2A_18800 [Variovorax dokdonensis]|uniref:hypothetical protein n=1 Tax=Variovorax dokdonensis TaxID=344883 RepID=UPI00363DD707
MLGIVKRQLFQAGAIEAAAGMPLNSWDHSRLTIEAKSIELGLGKWDETDLSVSREAFDAYTRRVRRAVGEGGITPPPGLTVRTRTAEVGTGGGPARFELYARAREAKMSSLGRNLV